MERDGGKDKGKWREPNVQGGLKLVRLSWSTLFTHGHMFMCAHVHVHVWPYSMKDLDAASESIRDNHQ